MSARFLPNFPRILYDREQKSVYLASLRKLTVSVLSDNFKKMEVLPFFSQLHQAFSKLGPF